MDLSTAFNNGFTKAAKQLELSDKEITQLSSKKAGMLDYIRNTALGFYHDKADALKGGVISMYNNPIGNAFIAANPFNPQIKGLKDYFTGMGDRFDTAGSAMKNMQVNHGFNTLKNHLTYGYTDAANNSDVPNLTSNIMALPQEQRSTYATQLQNINKGYNTAQAQAYKQNMQQQSQNLKMRDSMANNRFAQPGSILPKPAQPKPTVAKPAASPSPQPESDSYRHPYF